MKPSNQTNQMNSIDGMDHRRQTGGMNFMYRSVGRGREGRVVSRVGLVALLLSLTWSGATQARAADAASSVAAAPSVAAAAGTNAVTLDPHLEPLRPMLGRTWRGVFKSSRPDKPVVDVMHWERVLNGRGVRVLHSINDGSYGGETIFQWNGEKQVVTYHYFTTGGFMTTGTMRFEGGKFQTHEVVSGTTGGVREVKAVSGFEPDGTFVVKTEHLADGKWAPGRETVYREAPDAKVIFR